MKSSVNKNYVIIIPNKAYINFLFLFIILFTYIYIIQYIYIIIYMSKFNKFYL